MRNFYFVNLNLRMTVERSKRRSYFLSLVFITKSSVLERNYYALSLIKPVLHLHNFYLNSGTRELTLKCKFKCHLNP